MGPGRATTTSDRLLLALFAAVFAVALPSEVLAEPVRRAFLFSHSDGGPGLAKLRYAHRDVMKMRNVLTELGGFSGENIQVVYNQDSQDVIQQLRKMEERVLDDKLAGKEVLLLIYYSGHAKDGALRLGKTRLDMNLLRSMLEDSKADVRVALIDACGAGEITREKGGVKAPPLVVSVDDALTARGQVIIASSSDTEASQESDDIQGSFFTHYWVSGLRGDADRTGDGRVTLDEAYAYAYARTVAATVHSRGGVQHPTYRYNLRGAGDVVMANLGASTSVVRFPEDVSGRFMVFDLERQLVVAEVEKERGTPVRIAVKGGHYAIKKREPDHLLMQKVKVARASEHVVDPSQMEKVDFDDDYSKGAVITVEQPYVRKQGYWGLSLSGGMGAQAFFNLPGPPTNAKRSTNPLTASPTFPATTIATLQTRYHGLFNRHLLLSGDLNFGGREYTAIIDGGALGQLRYDAAFFMAELGAGAMWEQEIWRLRFAAGPRISTVFLFRHLYNAPVDNQFFMNMTPGLAGYVGFDIFRFLHVELGLRGSYLVYATDGFQNIGSVSATLAMHADL
ncbi:MAG: caspase family protein [Myxococcota bacterium]